MRTLAIIITLLSCGVVPARAADQRPNIILLLSDDQDWNGLSVRMHPDIAESRSDFFETPNLEKFAA
ncbi:MAG: sulfatase, partial [Verrucomicrobiota bacterium]